jgi:GWxTD domain-containing protein
MKNILLLFLFIVLPGQLAFSGTNQSQKINAKNTSIKDVLQLHPEYIVYHSSDSITKVFFRLKCSELLYVKYSKNIDVLVARGKIKYLLSPSYASTQIADSSSIYFVDTLKKNGLRTDIITGSFDIKMKYDQVLVCEVSLFDLNRGTDALSMMLLNKKTKKTRQNYFVQSSKDSLFLGQNYVTNDDLLSIKYDKPLAGGKLFVKYYLGEYLLPPPPFSYQDRKPLNFVPDSIFSVDLNSQSEINIRLKKRGIYHFVTDTSEMEGLTIIRYDHQLPEFNNALEMLKAIRFITTKQEYDDLLASDNLKLALDKYWLKCGQNNKDKAKNLIRNYYTRIEKSNNYFSSFDEGWKTDRGLVYLIFGAPQAVNRDNFSETWIYGDEKNSMRQVRFIYTKVENPFTDNDYILNRSESYKEIWYRNVDAWRMGRIINDN